MLQPVVSSLNSHHNYSHAISSHGSSLELSDKKKKTLSNWKGILKSVILKLEIRLGNKNYNLLILFLSYRHKVNRNLLCIDSYLFQCIPIWSSSSTRPTRIKMKEELVAWRCLARRQGITAIWIFQHGWCIWTPIINFQCIIPAIKMVLLLW